MPFAKPDFYYELVLRKKNFKLIAGLDEVGRGPICGPVVSAAVILPFDFNFKDINDSKLLTTKEREDLFYYIKSQAIAVGIGLVRAKDIDRTNILYATKISMVKAVKKLKVKPDFLLIDGNFTIPIQIPQMSIKRGDKKSVSIACASIIAKVVRDKIMQVFHKHYPNYKLDKNKGYPTLEHRELLKKYGPSPIHRFSFKPLKSLKSLNLGNIK